MSLNESTNDSPSVNMMQTSGYYGPQNMMNSYNQWTTGGPQQQQQPYHLVGPSFPPPPPSTSQSYYHMCMMYENLSFQADDDGAHDCEVSLHTVVCVCH